MKKSIKKTMIVLIVILAALVALSSGLLFLNRPADRNDTTYVTVTIEDGSSTHGIAETLKEAKVIRSVNSYKIISKLWRYDGKYKAGQYALSPSMRASDIGKIIVSGAGSTNTITIPEGYTVDQIAKKLAEDGIVDEEKFKEALTKVDYSKFDFLKDAQSGEKHLEGYLFPDTYQVSVGADEEQIIITMLNQFDRVFTDKYKKRAKELGLSENEIIIVASIIEREAKTDEDRAKVASVIYNRIKAGMPLQMCSTVQYILGKQKEVLSIADTKIESPYNTYLHAGLPAGPICSPGKAAIKAALYPAETDYLYFVVSEKLDGSHNFSATYAQFEKDTAAYEKALKERDSKN